MSNEQQPGTELTPDQQFNIDCAKAKAKLKLAAEIKKKQTIIEQQTVILK